MQFAHSGVRVGAARSNDEFCDQEVVDEVFINLPSEDYNSDLVSEFEVWGSM